MAANAQAVTKILTALEEIANQRLVLHNLESQLLDYNTTIAINWGSPPAFIQLDGDGNITGKNYSPGDVSNALGSLTQDRNALTNQTFTAGNHLGNFIKVASSALG